MAHGETEKDGLSGLDRLLSVSNVVDLLSISRSGLYRLMQRGEVVAVKVGKRTLFERSEIERLIESGKQGAPGSAAAGAAEDGGERAVVLLSGGLDSSTTLAIAQSEGHDAVAISFRYGQRHSIELEAARRIAADAGVAAHVIVDIDMRSVGGSALTDDIAVPKDREAEEMGEGIPVTYVPARNTVFLSYALAYAEVLEADHIWLGVNALDYSGYPDCRPEYIAAMEVAFNLATKRQVEDHRLHLHTPLIDLTKAEIIRNGLELGVDYGLTLSCYDPGADGAACGHCDSCQLRLKGFAENGIDDPARYQRGALAA